MDAIAEAKRLFNETWDLLDKQDRTPEDDIEMLHKAHTSCFLWRGAGKPVNNARGEWQVSRVYSALGMGAPALLHGQYSLSICLENAIGGLDLAFGHEAVARAQSVLGAFAEAAAAIARGTAAAQALDDAQDKAYVLGELSGIPLEA